MHKGLQLVILTTVISGFSVFANKFFVTKADPLIFAFLRNALVAVFFTSILLATKQIGAIKKITKPEWLKLFFVGTLGGGVAFALFFSGLAQIGAVAGNLINKSLFLWVALLAVPFLHEKIKLLHIVGFGCLLFATFVVGGPVSLSLPTGAYLVFAATLLWAVENVISKKVLKTVHPFVVGWARVTIGLPVLFLAVMVFGKGALLVQPISYTILPIVVSSVLLTGYMTSWYSALAKIPATVATAVLAGAPAITNILHTVFVSHTFPPQQQLSTVLLLVSSVVFLLSERKKTIQTV